MRSLITAIALFALAGCGGVLGVGYFGLSSYTPRVGTNQLKDAAMLVTVDKVWSGGFNTNIYLDVTVRNQSFKPADFDPADMVLIIRDTGISYFHVTKNNPSPNIPPGVQVMPRLQLVGGQAVRGMLMFTTNVGDAKMKALDIAYRAAMVHFPE